MAGEQTWFTNVFIERKGIKTGKRMSANERPRGLYFPHDANAHSDSNIIPMIHVYGFEGYGWYWRVLEQMRVSDGYKIQLGGKYGFHPIAAMLKTTPEMVENWIDDCVREFGLFERDCDGCLISSSFIARMQHIEHKIAQHRMSNTAVCRGAGVSHLYPPWCAMVANGGNFHPFLKS